MDYWEDPVQQDIEDKEAQCTFEHPWSFEQLLEQSDGSDNNEPGEVTTQGKCKNQHSHSGRKRHAMSMKIVKLKRKQQRSGLVWFCVLEQTIAHINNDRTYDARLELTSLCILLTSPKNKREQFLSLPCFRVLYCMCLDTWSQMGYIKDWDIKAVISMEPDVMGQPLVLSYLILSTMPLSSY